MTTCYAIGDVHGEAERLSRLHDLLVEDHARIGGPALTVHLGDLIDRGPDSRGAIERAMAIEAAPPAGMRGASVLGNHEALMLDAMKLTSAMDEVAWFAQGGAETLESYERVNGARATWQEAVDRSHLHWLRALPTMLREGPFVFVHGGIDPARFPNCQDEVRLWTRSKKFFDETQWPRRRELSDIVVVHGHTPTDDDQPEISARRINVDTGAVFGGPLTCAVLTPGEPPRFLRA